MKFKIIHSIDSKTEQLYFYKHFKWFVGRPTISLIGNQTVSMIKVITPRPDPILVSPELILKGCYNLFVKYNCSS